MALATSSSYTIEEVAGAATGPLWFQLYHYGNEFTPMLIERAEAAGYCALCVTADVAAGTIVTERERRDGYRRQFGVEYANFTCEAARLGLVSGTPAAMRWERPHPIPITWSDIEWFRSMTTLPIVLKGIMTAEDARMAVEHGIEAIIVSNHGGRTLDCQAATIDTLPEVVQAIEGRCEVYVDGGIRRGTDVLKALALGADAVLIGRPQYWGLAVDGEAGVKRVLDILRDEMARAMAYAGRASVASIDRSLVERPNSANG
jgi:isopentenyl diphosphate isomerase/L-lactate dehydrogenase-like FMN-dependent dehydrogenase